MSWASTIPTALSTDMVVAADLYLLGILCSSVSGIENGK
jgi:hypothetical protein